jgi:hypothetical protein
MYRLALVFSFFILLSGCNSIADSLFPTIQTKHNETMKNYPNEDHYATAIPITECVDYIGGTYRPVYQRDINIWKSDYFIGIGSDGSQAEAESYAIGQCEQKFGSACIVVLYNNTERCQATYASAIARQELRRRQRLDSQNQANAERQAAESLKYEAQCASFGFSKNTPEMANCLLELYKIANQPQQTTQTILDSARSSTADPAAAIELFNISRDILNNTGTRSAPAPTSVRCTKFGDFSGQVYTFNMACPMGYVQSF